MNTFHGFRIAKEILCHLNDTQNLPYHKRFGFVKEMLVLDVGGFIGLPFANSV